MMSQSLERGMKIRYADIKADIEPWIEHAVDVEGFDGLKTLWPVLMKAGLTDIEKRAEYCRILLMAIGLVDLHVHLLKATSGHWLSDYDTYHFRDDMIEPQLSSLRKWLNADPEADASEIARNARYDYLKKALDALTEEVGDDFGVFELFLQGLGLAQCDIRFENTLCAYSVFEEVYSNTH